MAVEQVAKGATSVEDRLKDVLKHLESESRMVNRWSASSVDRVLC